jgi:hypothetical protein
MTLTFPSDLRGLPGDTVPRSLAIPGSSSPELLLLSRVRHHSSPARRPQPPSTSLGFRSPSRHERPGSTLRWVSQAHLRSAHSVSHTPDGLLPHTPRRPISFRCHVRDSVSGIFLSSQPIWFVTSLCPPVVLRRSPAAESPHPRQFLPPRLQGFAPTADPLSPTGVLRLPTTRSPLKFSTLRVFLRTPWKRLHVPSAHGLSCRFLV